jgi:hypothetical protein
MRQAQEEAERVAKQREALEAELLQLQAHEGKLPTILTFKEASRKASSLGRSREEKLARRRARFQLHSSCLLGPFCSVLFEGSEHEIMKLMPVVSVKHKHILSVPLGHCQ